MKNLYLILVLILVTNTICFSQENNKPKVKTPNSKLVVDNIDLVKEGDDAILSFTITNEKESDISHYGLYTSNISEKTTAFDNLGNQYKITSITFGNNESELTASTMLPSDAPVKVVAKIANINSSATKLTVVKISGNHTDHPKLTDINGEFTFKELKEF